MTSASVIVGYSWENNTKADYSERDLAGVQISSATETIAKEELREDQKTREQCLEQLRSWIEKNEDIDNVRLDSEFLLRFLRVKKFSIPMAQQVLLKYLNLRKTFPHICNNLDFMTEAQNEILSDGYIFASPIRDSCGRRVVLMNIGRYNAKKYSSAEMAKANFIAYETLLADPENQVRGIVHVIDLSGTSPNHVTIWDPLEFPRVLKWGEQSLPLRHKEINIVKLPTTLKWLLDLVRGLISPKMKERLKTHLTINDLHKSVDPSVLPKEMGGSIPMKDMIEAWKKELAAKRELLLALDNMRLLSDRGIRKKNNTTEEDPLSGSFRKLEFD